MRPSATDPAARYMAAANSAAVYAHSDNYLVDLKQAVIVDVEATTAIRQAEVGAAKTMLDRTSVRPNPLTSGRRRGAAARPRCWVGWWRSVDPKIYGNWRS
jgi:hypothetical protein